VTQNRTFKKTNHRRSKATNPQTGNTVYTSHGPFGLVRGTAHQIIERYEQLARDAQLAGDTVATESCLQHVEHYVHVLGAAKRAEDARREDQAQRTRERQAELAKANPESGNLYGGAIALEAKAEGREGDSAQIQKRSSQQDARTQRLLEAGEAFGKAL
jgi:hypothetical protein